MILCCDTSALERAGTRPAWLAQAHEALDAAVAVAYGWTDYTPSMA